jgi:hypothetical protein
LTLFLLLPGRHHRSLSLLTANVFVVRFTMSQDLTTDTLTFAHPSPRTSQHGGTLPVPQPGIPHYKDFSHLCNLFSRASKACPIATLQLPRSLEQFRCCNASSPTGGCLGLEEVLLDYRKPTLDGSLYCGDEFEVSEKGVHTHRLLLLCVKEGDR